MHVLHLYRRSIIVGRENGGAHGQPSAETERADSLKSRQATEIGPCVPFSRAICVSQHPVIALCCSIDFVLNPGLVTDTLSYYLQPFVPSPPPFSFFFSHQSSEYLPTGADGISQKAIMKIRLSSSSSADYSCLSVKGVCTVNDHCIVAESKTNRKRPLIGRRSLKAKSFKSNVSTQYRQR